MFLVDFSTEWCLIHWIRRFASSWTASLPGQTLEHVQPWGTHVFHEEKQRSTPLKTDQEGQITRVLSTLGASMRRFALDEVQQCGNFWIFLATSRRKSGSVHLNWDLTKSRHFISTLNFQDAATRYTCVVSRQIQPTPLRSFEDPRFGVGKLNQTADVKAAIITQFRFTCFL